MQLMGAALVILLIASFFGVSEGELLNFEEHWTNPFYLIGGTIVLLAISGFGTKQD